MVHPGLQQPFQGIPDACRRLAWIPVDQVPADPPEPGFPSQGDGRFRIFCRMDPSHGCQFGRLEGLDAQAQPVEAQLPVKLELVQVHRPRIGLQGGFCWLLPESPLLQGRDHRLHSIQRQYTGSPSAEIHRSMGRNRQSRRTGGDFLRQTPGIVAHDMFIVNLIGSEIAVGTFMDTEWDVDIDRLIRFPGLCHAVPPCLHAIPMVAAVSFRIWAERARAFCSPSLREMGTIFSMPSFPTMAGRLKVAPVSPNSPFR